MSSQGKNVLIGLFAMIALAVAIWGLLFLNPRVGDGAQILRVRFSSVSGIEPGTRVTFAGKPVGRVVAINQIFDAREQPLDRFGKIYFFEVVLGIDSKVEVYDTDEVVLMTTGLFGEKSIAIIPEAPPEGVTPELVGEQIIYGISSDRMEQTLTQVVRMAGQMEETFVLINELLVETDEDLKQMFRSVGAVSDELTTAMRSINEENLIPATVCAMEGVCTAMGHLDEMANGGGTLGQLLTNEELYLQMTHVMERAERLMSDLNEYGLLFHMNRGWQRQRRSCCLQECR